MRLNRVDLILQEQETCFTSIVTLPLFVVLVILYFLHTYFVFILQSFNKHSICFHVHLFVPLIPQSPQIMYVTSKPFSAFPLTSSPCSFAQLGCCAVLLHILPMLTIHIIDQHHHLIHHHKAGLLTPQKGLGSSPQ